jgi:XTP/dITP diphosphohydrolase
MDILLASNNRHKHDEFTRLFPGHTILAPRDAGIEFDYEEGDQSFLDNALGKARALFAISRMPVLSDDSGLCVQALGDEPGVRSSRYGAAGGQLLDAPARNQYLLSRMLGIAERSAYFVCCLVLMMDRDRFLVAQETVHGSIADAPRGKQGFGYDPLFLVPASGKTIAELPEGEKDRISHRGRASRRIAAALERGG